MFGGRSYLMVTIMITSLKEGVCIHAGEYLVFTRCRKLQEMIIDLDFRNQDLHSFYHGWEMTCKVN